MPRVSQHPKADSFNFRIDPALKAAFTQATEAEDKPAAQVLRDFMRAYVERRNRKAFEAEARRLDDEGKPGRFEYARPRFRRRSEDQRWPPGLEEARHASSAGASRS